MSSRWSLIAGLSVSMMLARCVGLSVQAEEKTPTPTAAAADEKPSTPERPAAEKYKLEHKFQPNQLVRYEVTNETEITTHIKGNAETTKNASRAKRHFKVIKVDENSGEADLELCIDWVSMVASFEKPGGIKSEPFEYQSDDPEKQPRQFQDVQATVGKPSATIRFSPSGKPVKIIKGNKLPDSPAKTPASLNPATPAVHDTTAESYLLPLPEQPVAIGGSWKDRFDVVLRDNDKNLNRIVIQQNYKLADVKDDRAVIEFQTVVLTPVQNPTILGQLIQREIAGKAIFDLKRGIVISRESGVDNTVVGPFGPQTSMKAKSQYQEKLIEDDNAGAAATAAATTPPKQ